MADTKSSPSESAMQPPESRITIHDFKDKILENAVYFQVIKLEDSFLVWVGAKPNFENLAMAMSTQFSTTPIGSCLMGNSTDSVSVSLAQKLAKKTKKQVFVSYNLPADYTTLPLVEKRLFEEMKVNPEKF